MFSLSLSNRFEVLLDELVERLRRPATGSDGQSDPFVAPQVIVPGTAVQRRIQLALAQRAGIAANVSYAYLGQWLWRRIGEFVPVDAESPFAPARLAWRLYATLGDAAFVAAHPRLAGYLEQADALMRLDLARRVATLFDHYITYRPDWLERWADGATIAGLQADAAQRGDEAWQAALWRDLLAALGGARRHPSAAFFEMLARGQGDAAARRLPPAVDVFCLPSMPPMYADMLRRLAQWVDVRVYALNPCQEYWFEIVDRKRYSELVVQGRADHHEVAHGLLAAWGQAAQAQLGLLLADDAVPVVQHDDYRPAGGASLLARVQDAILALVEPPPGSLVLAEDDRSIEVHVCHGLTRELEVLHDRLLALFAAPGAPRLDDVVVLTPDLERAAPMIDAVFGTAPDERRIAYRITGQSQRRVNPVARALDDLLTLAAGRWPASAVFAWLEQPPVARRFGLDDEALARIRDWIQASGIRWGADGAHRRALALPGEDRHSFADGLQRLFLAYATGRDDALLGGRLAAAHPEGQDALALGRFARAIEALGVVREQWQQPRAATGWRDALLGALDRFVAEDPAWIDADRAARAAIAALHEDMCRSGLHEPLPLAVVQSALARALEDPAHGAVPTGEVTFSAIGALRGLPYRVVCVIGLDDGVFPSPETPQEFDLMAAHPRRGDRQRRLDERNLFLDCLLAARETLHLSYTGRSVRDNSPMPPSVVVSELLDHLSLACAAAPADAEALAAVRRRLTVEHPLQPFSPVYFGAQSDADPRLVSFRADYGEALSVRAEAAGAIDRVPPAVGVPDGSAAGVGEASDRAHDAGADVGGDEAGDAQGDAEADDEQDLRAGRPFFVRPLAPPDEPWRQVRLAQLVAFFANPFKVLLEDRLGLRVPRPSEELSDEEPFTLDRLDRHALFDRLLPRALAGADDATLRALALAGTELPDGPLAERGLDRELAGLRAFAGQLAPELAVAPGAPRTLRFDATIADEPWRLEHVFADLRPRGRVRYRFATARAVDYLTGWIEHLALCAMRDQDPSIARQVAAETHWHSADGQYTLVAVDQAGAILQDLLALYRDGLMAPTPFLPRTAWAYCTQGDNLRAAQQVWEPPYGPGRGDDRGEHADRFVALALRGRENPLDAAFERTAMRVLHPLLAHLRDARIDGAAA